MNSENLWKPMELAMLNQTDHSPDMKVSYFEVPHRMSCSLFTHMAWLIPDAYPEVGDDGLSIPNNMNTFSTMPAMSAERLQPFQHQNTSKYSITQHQSS